MKKILIFILSLQGLSAVAGGEELIRTNGSGMKVEWLANSPFDSFLIPGLLLILVIGGTSLGASFLLIKKHKRELEASTVAGFGILIWIFAQIYMIQMASFLQAVYFASGIIILSLTFEILRDKSRNNS